MLIVYIFASRFGFDFYRFSFCGTELGTVRFNIFEYVGLLALLDSMSTISADWCFEGLLSTDETCCWWEASFSLQLLYRSWDFDGLFFFGSISLSGPIAITKEPPQNTYLICFRLRETIGCGYCFVTLSFYPSSPFEFWPQDQSSPSLSVAIPKDPPTQTSTISASIIIFGSLKVPKTPVPQKKSAPSSFMAAVWWLQLIFLIPLTSTFFGCQVYFMLEPMPS